jgi:hypothetical protein
MSACIAAEAGGWQVRSSPLYPSPPRFEDQLEELQTLEVAASDETFTLHALAQTEYGELDVGEVTLAIPDAATAQERRLDAPMGILIKVLWTPDGGYPAGSERRLWSSGFHEKSGRARGS